MKHLHTQQGYSMVEVLVAISILLLATVGPMTIASRSLQYAQFSAEQNTAFFLAQEGIEAVFKVRADAGIDHLDNPSGNPAWDWMSDSDWADCRGANGCGIDWRDGSLASNVVECDPVEDCQLYFTEGNDRARYTHETSGEPTPYTRVITVDPVSPTEAILRAQVFWEASGTGDVKTITLQTYVHDIYESN